MSLECLAILGNRNEPIYFCDGSSASEKEKNEKDYFGFFDTDWQQGKGNATINIRHEVRKSWNEDDDKVFVQMHMVAFR